MIKIFFNGKSFNNFPVHLLNNNTIVYILQEYSVNNITFIKNLIIKGLIIIYISAIKKIDDNIFSRNLFQGNEISLIIKDDDVVEYNKVPILYFDDNLFSSEQCSEYKISCLCKSCNTPFIKVYNLKQINNCFNFCSDKCFEDLPLNSTEDLCHIEKLDLDRDFQKTSIKSINIPNRGIYLHVNISSNKDEKFQDSMKREATRLAYASKREDYKKQMRQISTKKSNTSSISNTSDKVSKLCRAKTKKGVKCTNKIIKNSEYCGIASHRNLGSCNGMNIGSLKISQSDSEISLYNKLNYKKL